MKKICNTISTLAAIFLFAAAAFMFKCPKMESGAYMNCHKANVMVAIISCILIVLNILLFLIKNRNVSSIISGLVILASIVSAIVPGIIISLCMMPEMTCRAIFRPVDVICSILIIAFTAVSLFIKEVK
jgi:uncharacterized membrane protein